MGDSHSFENTVVAVLAAGLSDDALQQLSAAGYDYEVMEGESGGRHLDPGGEGGIWSALKRAAAALGDETRVLDRLDSELAEGKLVVSVDISGREGKTGGLDPPRARWRVHLEIRGLDLYPD